MAGISFTPAQKQAVEALGGNLLVSAAAGSGKTAVLTERVIGLLTGENPVSADRLIVVTFTVAAAEEMRRRIGTRLDELSDVDPQNEWLLSQKLLLPRAKICTIHSLCSGIIRDNFQKLGFSGDLKIAEEADLAVMKQQSCDEIFEEYYEAQNPEFLELVEFTCVKNDRPLVQTVLSVYDFIRSFSFPLDFLEHSLSMYEDALSLDDNVWASLVCEHAASAIHYCEDIIGDAIREMRKDETVAEKYEQAFREDLIQFSGLRELLDERQLAKASAFACAMSKTSLKPVRGYDNPEFLEHLKGRRKKAYDVFESLFI